MKKKSLLVMMIAIFMIANCAEEKTNNDDLLLVAAVVASANASPTVRFVNKSGVTESFSFHSVSGCTDAAVYTLNANPVANGVTTGYESFSEGTYFKKTVDSNGNSSCTTSGKYSKGTSYTCTSSTTSITCASP